MAVSAAGDKGYRGERPIEVYLQGRYGRGMRPRAGQRYDVGDIVGFPLVISVKNHKSAALSTWVDEMSEMVVSAGMQTGIVWHKRLRIADPAGWYVTTNGRLFEPLLDAWMEKHG